MFDKLKNLNHKESGNFFLIAGPCVIESKEVAIEIAERILTYTDKLKIPFIFKASYKKANRSKLDSFTGIGDTEALNIIKTIGEELRIPTTTDIHNAQEAVLAAEYVDMIQIPAFLCRQTDILISAAKTGKMVNIKKGQFLSPKSIKHATNKVKENGNNSIMLTERGSMFGYKDMVVDFRAIPKMKKIGYPVCLDVTHSLQQPNQDNGVTGGDPEMIETIAKAGIATGSDGIFLETHPKPSIAKSDGKNMLHLDQLEELLVKLVKIRKSLI